MPKGEPQRQWVSEEERCESEEKPKVASCMIDPSYEGYLLLLQERNKIVKKLQKKDPKQIELEKKEQGFSLYLNGANTDNKRVNVRAHLNKQKPYKPKSSAGSRKYKLTSKEIDDILAERIKSKLRAKTAPEKSRRKNWNVGSLEIKTHCGEKVKVKAPEILTGKYADDFEDDLNDDNSYDSSSDSQHTSDSRSSSEKEDNMISRQQSSSSSCDTDCEETEHTEQIPLSMRDVKKLRQSLEMNFSLRHKLMHTDLDFDSGNDRDSPITEEDSFQVSTSSSSDENDSRKTPHINVKMVGDSEQENEAEADPKRDNVIVLEFSESHIKDAKQEPLASRVKDTKSLAADHNLQRSHGGREDRSHKHKSHNEDLRIERSKELTLKPSSVHKKTSQSQAGNHSSKYTNDIEKDEPNTAQSKQKKDFQRAGRQHRSSKSAPGCRYKDGSPTNHHAKADRPASTALSGKNQPNSTEVTDHMGGTHDSWAIPAHSFRNSSSLQLEKQSHSRDHIESIVEKVLKLDQKTQHRLLRALSEIEKTDGTSGCSFSKYPVKKATKVKVKEESCRKPITVIVNLLSNWGHPSRIGLTEIQFFDQIQNRLDVNPDDIQVTGARDAKGDLAALSNGKCKTIKERNMWSCMKPDKCNPVSLSFTIKPNNTSAEGSRIGKIRFWNYNKSPHDLCVGVRDISLEVNGKIVYSGQIDKGCGNQVFNYSTDISLLSESEKAELNKDNHQSEHKKAQTEPERYKLEGSKHSPPLRINRNDNESGMPHNSVTPTMDKVTLFSNVDCDEEMSLHSNRQFTDHKQPEAEDKNGASDADRSKNTDRNKPRESNGVPNRRHRKHKDRERKSKMAARLDGSESSIDSSFAGNSVDKGIAQYSDDSQKSSKETGKKSLQKSAESKISALKPEVGRHNTSDDVKETSMPSERTGLSKNPRKPNFNSAKNNDHQSNRKKASIFPKHLDILDDEIATSPKPGSPYYSDEDTGSMLDQLRKITKVPGMENVPEWLTPRDRKPAKGDLPPWLTTADDGSNDANGTSENKNQKQKDDSLLDNWPTVGIPDLPTILDDERSASPKPVGRPHSRNLPVPDLDEDSGRNTPNRMREIEQKRNEWKRKEQFKLEESWTSLSLFDRLQKGRISLDLQKDVLDEYLSPEKCKPSEPTILEESAAPSKTSALEEETNSFEIPELPMGKEMIINILTTWGDHHYVGLNGIEVFTSTGELATVTKITADPEDINILEGYSKDPRVVTNLIDGINHTRDDTHMWLAPYTKGSKHLIFLTFNKPIQIAMMRIWNYNKSRIHSYRGAKDIEITLDNELIFKGEVTRASGGIIGRSDSFAETILFTTDEDILELVSRHDQAFEMDMIVDAEAEEDVQRPKTADETNAVERPFTSAAYGRQHPVRRLDNLEVTSEDDTLVLKGQNLQLNFTSTWGDPYYLGLTGLEVIGPDGSSLPISIDMVDADPRDLHILPGYENDDRTLDKLFDGINITTSDEHMWLVPYTSGEDHILTINMGKPVEMCGLRIWNYNKSPEDTYRGAKTVHVTLDGCQVSPPDGFLLRKGPGNCFFDFAQEVSFTEPQTPRSVVTKHNPPRPSDSLVLDEASQEYEVIQKPCGFIYQFQLLSTWGDPYYVGLNGLEFYDSQGNQIQLEENNISAYPESVNVLDGMENDTRTPDKLIDGENDTTDGSHMWLAPVLPNTLNRVYIIFDTPMEISMIKIWNYRKTPKRGVKDFALLVDDLLVYNGLLEMAEPCGRGILPTCDGPQRYHTILFTDDKEIQRREKHTIIKKQTRNQDVQLMNDRQVVATYSDPTSNKSRPIDQSKRPKTSVLGWGRKR